ncbi:RNA ligase family protein [Brevibacillus brevis]|uniref:RNA ligase family protein n=1 Tax=Brevibacillus brevis TaxID=1393 RepID=UPI0007D8B178|nr:RNA ligase family protein [Brevibacillus brevis]
MDQKKYMDVVRLGHKTTIGVLTEGDQIIIQEKIDGANASFRYDEETDTIRAFSRNTELNEENTLGGFYQWTQQLPKEELMLGAIYFGEWLNPHKVKYPEYMKQFFLFDIYNTYTGEYVEFSMVEDEAKRLELNLVPVFYKGDYKGYEHLESFVGKSMLGGKLGDLETGEGIVVKNIKYKDRFSKQLFVKLVTDVFREVQSQKAPKDPNQLKTPEMVFVEQYVTQARIEKFLYKLVDEGVLDAQFGIEDMGLILKSLNGRIYEDLLKEESDYLPVNFEEKELRKSIGRVVPLLVKGILASNAA